MKINDLKQNNILILIYEYIVKLNNYFKITFIFIGIQYSLIPLLLSIFQNKIKLKDLVDFYQVLVQVHAS